MTKIKICGITNDKDALWATNLGTDYIGLNFCENSLRKVSLPNAKKILSKLPPFVQVVGVFVDKELTELIKIAKKINLAMVQLHGNESVEYCEQLKLQTTGLNLKICKVFKIQDEQSLTPIFSYLDVTDYFLVDTYVPGMEGGTGEVFNWDLAVKVKEYNKPIFLAGGLNPDNVLQAIEKVKPYAVDVASGVERLPRRKDYDKMKLFISRVRGIA